MCSSTSTLVLWIVYSELDSLISGLRIFDFAATFCEFVSKSKFAALDYYM
jgi:hypothetical protein